MIDLYCVHSTDVLLREQFYCSSSWLIDLILFGKRFAIERLDSLLTAEEYIDSRTFHLVAHVKLLKVTRGSILVIGLEPHFLPFL